MTNNIPALPADLIAAIDSQTPRDQRLIRAAIELGHCWQSDHYDSPIAGLIAAAADHAYDAVNSTGESRAYSLGMAKAYERMAREAIAAAAN